MYFKKISRVIVLVISILWGLIYFIVIYFGGFGQKELSNNFKLQNERAHFFSHRGLSLYFAEGSLVGVNEAFRVGLSSELDISKSADNELIIFHDENCLRLLGFDKEVNTLKLSEIKKYPIIFNEQKSNSFVATVEELLKHNRKNRKFYFDMKLTSFEDAESIAKIIKTNHSTASVIVANSNILFIWFLEINHPEIITALEGFDAGKEWIYTILPKDLKPDFLSGYLRNSSLKHTVWLKENDLMSRRIVYGVDSSNIDFALLSGYKNIILDYDTTLHKKTLLNKFWVNPSTPGANINPK